MLNRYCVEAAVGEPLTVYGKGGQTRGFLDIRDTVRCIELAALNAPAAGEYRVYNQFTEQFSVLELAEKVEHARAAHGLPTTITHVPNPRREKEDHYYNAKHQRLLDLGLEPHGLSDTLIDSVIQTVEGNISRVRRETIEATIDWRKGGGGLRGSARDRGGGPHRRRWLAGRRAGPRRGRNRRPPSRPGPRRGPAPCRRTPRAGLEARCSAA